MSDAAQPKPAVDGRGARSPPRAGAAGWPSLARRGGGRRRLYREAAAAVGRRQRRFGRSGEGGGVMNESGIEEVMRKINEDREEE